MKKDLSRHRYLMAAVALVAGAPGGAALAATLSNGHGQTCAAGFVGTWHFVNNQTGVGAPQGTITATWSSGDTCTAPASKINRRVQHFYCTAAGTLVSAQTNLPGRLVLSDFTCHDPKTPPPPPPPPPPCDPYKDPYCPK